MTPRDLPDETLQLSKGFRSLPLFALYKKHRRDLLMVPGISLGITLPENQELSHNVPLAEPKVLAMVNVDESLGQQNRTRHYRR
jgi:hypothetical protein